MTENDAILATIRAAATIARSDHDNWSRFVEALRAYSATQDQNCIQAPLDQLVKAQGRALGARSVLDLVTDCVAKADRLQGRNP